VPIVFHSRVFDVEVDTRRRPDGREHEVVIVRHRPSVVIVPFTDDGRVVMVRQYRAPLDRHTWEFPAGGVEEGEFVETAAARECEEEIGLVPGRFEHLGSWYPVPGYCDEQMIFFRVSMLRPPAPDSPHKPDEDEEIETRTLSVNEVRTMANRGEIVDLKTVFALTLMERNASQA
jgi:ADP-ribose pyrophosphatase